MASDDASAKTVTTTLGHYLSPMNVWALALGCAIGWGAFVMPATTLLPKAGPLGTVIGMAIAAIIMVVVAANFHYMLNIYPESGGAVTFTRKTLGYDHAFLCAWALILAYISIMWANATAFILICRFLLGPVFQFGFHYVVAGYDVYFGEILVTLGVFVVFGLFSMSNRKLIQGVNTVLALVLFFGVVACLIMVFGFFGVAPGDFEPAFSPGTAPGVGVFGIVALAPWAFLGFESVAHGAGELNFKPRKLFGIMTAAVICAALIYIFMTLVSVMGTPPEYANWADYINDLGNRDGLAGLPTFFAMQETLGDGGVLFLGVVVLAAISTSLIGLNRAASRLFYVSAQAGVLPSWFGKLSKDGIPRNAVIFIMLISFVVPFVGRAAIGWIVDVTSVSASVVYAYASVCSFLEARKRGNKPIVVTAVIGMVSSAVFLVYPLVPNVWSVSALAPESYLILAAWGAVGLVLFRLVFNRDKDYNFGKSTVVWILMVFLILFASTMWVRQVMHDETQEIIVDMGEYYAQEYDERGIVLTDEEMAADETRLAERTNQVQRTLLDSSLVQMLIIIFSLAIMFNIYALLRRRETQTDAARAAAEETSKAKTTFLSNMSHDIRTPMNAIIGYTHLAQREGISEDEMREYLVKIDGSSKHLLALINDVLEMSRIESGKMELDVAEVDLRRVIGDVRDMFATQMNEKGIIYLVDAQDVRDNYVMCDENRLNRVLLNLVSNAYKFTDAGGTVAVSLAQTSEVSDGRASYELRVKDTGIGMTPEFAEKVFEEFERERSSTVSGIQGTGLGTAITKNIVEMMGGTIDVVTELGEGSEFIVRVSFDVVERTAEELAAAQASSADEVDFTGKRILLVEDNEINREIATLILEEAGFVIDTAENGKVALDKVAASAPGDYDLVLMDVQMPVMDGYEATRAIRQLPDPALAGIPIVAASANAFAEDVQAARDAGMDGHVAKPLDVDKVMAALAEQLA